MNNSREPELNSRQIALLRDFRHHGWMSFFDSAFRLYGPALREMGMFEGIGDSTRISEAGMAALNEADAKITRNVAKANHSRGTSVDKHIPLEIPTPWELIEDRQGYLNIHHPREDNGEKTGDLVATCFQDERHANLIKATPEMLKALIAALDSANELGLSSSVFPRRLIESAILKATSTNGVIHG